MNQVRAGALLNYVIIGLNTLTGLLYTPYMLKCLGQNEYGLYSLVGSVISYLTLLDFGFGAAIVRFTSKIKATKSQNEEWSLYGMFISAYLIIGLIVSIAGIILYYNVDYMFDMSMNPEELNQARIMLGLMVFNLAITFPFSVFGSIISAYENFIFQRLLSIFRIILCTIVLVAVLSIGYKAVGLVIVQTIFSITTLIANALYCKYKLHIKVLFKDFNFSLLKEVIIFSFWNFLAAIVDRIYWGTGQFILGIYSGTVAVAIFSLAITLMNLYMSMSTSFNSVLLPRITVMTTKENNETEISNLFIKTGRLQFCVLSFILSAFIVLGKQFINIWVGDAYSESYIITIIFFIALFCPLIQNVGYTILLARGQQRFRSLVYLGIAIISLLFQIGVTKTYGPIGCAIVIGSTLIIGQWFIMNFYYYFNQNINIPKFWVEIIKMSIAPIIVTGIGIYIMQTLDIKTWSHFVIGSIIYSAIYAVPFYIFSMNNYERNCLISPFKTITLKFL